MYITFFRRSRVFFFSSSCIRFFYCHYFFFVRFSFLYTVLVPFFLLEQSNSSQPVLLTFFILYSTCKENAGILYKFVCVFFLPNRRPWFFFHGEDHEPRKWVCSLLFLSYLTFCVEGVNHSPVNGTGACDQDWCQRLRVSPAWIRCGRKFLEKKVF